MKWWLKNGAVLKFTETDETYSSVEDTRKGFVMDNQHRQIKGYRELSQEEINLMNRIKEHGVALEALIKDLRAAGSDQRWVSIGATDLQTGLMALTRSVAQPTFF